MVGGRGRRKSRVCSMMGGRGRMMIRVLGVGVGGRLAEGRERGRVMTLLLFGVRWEQRAN